MYLKTSIWVNFLSLEIRTLEWYMCVYNFKALKICLFLTNLKETSHV